MISGICYANSVASFSHEWHKFARIFSRIVAAGGNYESTSIIHKTIRAIFRKIGASCGKPASHQLAAICPSVIGHVLCPPTETGPILNSLCPTLYTLYTIRYTLFGCSSVPVRVSFATPSGAPEANPNKGRSRYEGEAKERDCLCLPCSISYHYYTVVIHRPCAVGILLGIRPLSDSELRIFP